MADVNAPDNRPNTTLTPLPLCYFLHLHDWSRLGNRMRILIIEDNEDIVLTLFEYFEPAGHVLDNVRSGIAGLERLREDEFDVVILDGMLPGLDGLEVCRRIREELKLPVPVLMLTARDTVKDKVDGFRFGADDYLVKPFSLIELGARLEALVR